MSALSTPTFHAILSRLAPHGGEATLLVLFVLSIVCFAITAERIVYFWQIRVPVDRFVRYLAPLIKDRDYARATALCQRTNASVSVIALAGLALAESGVSAAREAMQTAMAGERLRLEHKVAVLSGLGRVAILIGLLGSLLDLLAMSQLSGPAATVGSSSVPWQVMLGAVAPLAAGLFVATESWLAFGLFQAHLQRTQLENEFVARLVSSQLGPNQAATAAKAGRAA